MANIKYGTTIIVLEGLFKGCNGIFFTNCKDNKCEIEVFFRTKAIDCPENVNDYFKDYLFNKELPTKMTSAVIKISKEYIEEWIK